jgi:hypothetical protein
MSLQSNFQAFYSTQRQTELTNPQAEEQSSVNTTRLALVCNFAEKVFATYTGVAYDDTVYSHVEAAVRIVEILLMHANGQIPQGERNSMVKEALQDLALVTGRNRIMPQTDSTYVRTPRNDGLSESVLEEFDWTKFSIFNTQGPGGESPTSDD